MSDDEIPVCPECDSASISANVGTNYPNPAAGHGWRCKQCSATFDEPVRREPYPNGNQTRSGPAKALLDADPDDYPKDGGSV